MAKNDISDILSSNATAKEALETLAKIKRNGVKPAYTDYRLMAYRLADYLYKKIEIEKAPVTKTGLRMSLLMPQQTYQNYRDGDNDLNSMACDKDGTPLESREGNVDNLIEEYRDRLEIQPYYYQLTGSNEEDAVISFSVIIKNAEDFFNEQVENYTFTRGNVVDIFNSKVHLGYQDDSGQHTPQTVNQTLIVSGDSADKALAHIGLKLIEE